MSKELTICNRIYSWLYNSKEELPSTFFLSLDESLSRDEDYNAFKLNLINERMDYFTSDREIVSLVLTYLVSYAPRDMLYSAHGWINALKKWRYMYGAWFTRLFSTYHMYNLDFIVWYADMIKQYGKEFFTPLTKEKKIALMVVYMATHDCNEEDE